MYSVPEKLDDLTDLTGVAVLYRQNGAVTFPALDGGIGCGKIRIRHHLPIGENAAGGNICERALNSRIRYAHALHYPTVILFGCRQCALKKAHIVRALLRVGNNGRELLRTLAPVGLGRYRYSVLAAIFGYHLDSVKSALECCGKCLIALLNLTQSLRYNFAVHLVNPFSFVLRQRRTDGCKPSTCLRCPSRANKKSAPSDDRADDTMITVIRFRTQKKRGG